MHICQFFVHHMTAHIFSSHLLRVSLDSLLKIMDAALSERNSVFLHGQLVVDNNAVHPQTTSLSSVSPFYVTFLICLPRSAKNRY